MSCLLYHVNQRIRSSAALYKFMKTIQIPCKKDQLLRQKQTNLEDSESELGDREGRLRVLGLGEGERFLGLPDLLGGLEERLRGGGERLRGLGLGFRSKGERLRGLGDLLR